ncbi:hypothetical protein BJX65DRAFT_92663 [Aspergillus insuetus]
MVTLTSASPELNVERSSPDTGQDLIVTDNDEHFKFSTLLLRLIGLHPRVAIQGHIFWISQSKSCRLLNVRLSVYGATISCGLELSRSYPNSINCHNMIMHCQSCAHSQSDNDQGLADKCVPALREPSSRLLSSQPATVDMQQMKGFEIGLLQPLDAQRGKGNVIRYIRYISLHYACDGIPETNIWPLNELQLCMKLVDSQSDSGGRPFQSV